MPRPLWRVLLDMQRQDPTPLTEAECVAVLEFLAEELAAGCDPRVLQPLIDRCLVEIPRRRTEAVFAQLLGAQRGSKE
ncbi:MAG: hypothetical protein ACE5I2_08495 [Anaerolineae bacterium]